MMASDEGHWEENSVRELMESRCGMLLTIRRPVSKCMDNPFTFCYTNLLHIFGTLVCYIESLFYNSCYTDLLQP